LFQSGLNGKQWIVSITGGPNFGIIRGTTDNTGDTITFGQAFPNPISAGTDYVIYEDMYNPHYLSPTSGNSQVIGTIYENVGDAESEFSGKRKYRGLYVSNGFAVNADVNGSLNIGRKVIPEFAGIGDRSLAARPVVINPLKV
jgi:hypothetical protein